MYSQMMTRMIAGLAVFFVMAGSKVAMACSVCQGDPNNKLTQGAQAGVLMMAIMTYVLLLGMAALVASWFIRQNRQLRRVTALRGDSELLGDEAECDVDS